VHEKIEHAEEVGRKKRSFSDSAPQHLQPATKERGASDIPEDMMGLNHQKCFNKEIYGI